MRGPQMLTAGLSLLACITATLSSVTAPSELSALEGGVITTPCHYDPALANHVKYWCRGRFKDLCSMLARTDTPKSDPRVTIADVPGQQLFTVTMEDLKEEESGWYHCGVEEGGIWTADWSAAVHITVIHGMSVASSSVTGVEGASVTVRCLYSRRYRAGEKSWCRSGNKDSCVSTGTEGRYDGPSVAIADDRVSAFTVTVRRLRLADDGWYWCGVGQEKIDVHVVVTPRPPTTARPAMSTSDLRPRPPVHGAMGAHDVHRHVQEIIAVCASIVFVVCAAIFVRRRLRHHRKLRWLV